MVLPRPLAHPHQQMVVFVHQSPHQRPVIGRQDGDQIGERSVLRLAAGEGGGAAALLAMLAGALDGGGLGLNQADGLENLPGGARFDLFLLAVQQGEHFAVVLQFFAQGGNERLNSVSSVFHGCWLDFLPKGTANGVRVGASGAALGKT